MKCHEHSIFLYWSGELSPPQQAEVEQHLTECWHCQQVLADVHAVDRHISALPLLTPDRDLVRPAAERACGWTRWRQFLTVPAFRYATSALVISALVLIVVWQVTTDRQGPLETPPIRASTALRHNRLSRHIAQVQGHLRQVETRIRQRAEARPRRNRSPDVPRELAALRREVEQLKTRLVKTERFRSYKTLQLRRT